MATEGEEGRKGRWIEVEGWMEVEGEFGRKREGERERGIDR